MRRVLIVVVLLWGMNELGRFQDVHGGRSMSMVAFGFIVLAAYALGELAERIRLPHISGYLLAGVACGPHLLGLLDQRAVTDLKVFDTLAIALIAMEAGAALDVEELKRSWRTVSVLSVALIVFTLLAALGFAFAVGGWIPGIVLPMLDGAPIGLVVAVALLLGVMMVATSPPVTLAVLTEARAEGPFTRTLLPTVIVNNIQVVVLFALALAVAQALAGGGHAEAGAGAVLVQFGWSLLLGVLAGALAAAGMRVLGPDGLLGVVGICFFFSWLAGLVEASPLLTFLVAGAFLKSATRQGPAFNRASERLAGPVYVLFFTLIGADLHLDAIARMAPFAVTVVLLRLGAFHLSVQAAGRLVPLPDTMRRYGAMGFSPQAGIALTIAIGVGHAFEGWGPAFEMLGLAAIALNEMVGPVLLKASLSLAGESAAARARSDGEDEEADEEPATDTEAPTIPPTGDPRLDRLVVGLGAELEGAFRDHVAPILAERAAAAEARALALRRAFLRCHRRVAVLAARDLGPEEAADAIRRESAELLHQWRSLALTWSAQAEVGDLRTALDRLVRTLDEAVDRLPAALESPLQPAWFELDPALPRAQLAARTWWRVRAWLGRPHRVVPVRDVARIHLGARLAGRMQEVAGSALLPERQFLRSLRRVNASALACFQRAGRAVRERDVGEVAQGLRLELESEFEQLTAEIRRTTEEARHLQAIVPRQATAELARDLAVAGAPGHPARRYRFSRFLETRSRALAALAAALEATATELSGGLALLGLEMELEGFAANVDDAVRGAASYLRRQVEGRLALQANRLGAAIEEALPGLQHLLALPEPWPVELREGLQEVAAPLQRVADEVVTAAHHLHDELAAGDPFAAPVSELSARADQATSHIDVALLAAGPAGLRLPDRVETVYVPLRRLVQGMVEVEVRGRLEEALAGLRGGVERCVRALDEVARVLAFNFDLARTELEVLPDEPIPEETRALLSGTVVDTTARMGTRAAEVEAEAAGLAEQVAVEVPDALLGVLKEMIEDVQRGTLQDVRTRMVRWQLAEGRRELRTVTDRLRGLRRQLHEGARIVLGQRRIERLRAWSGLPPSAPPAPASFLPPAPRIELPVAYRRLFSPEALETGDHLTGHDRAVDRLRRVLSGEAPGGRRSAALVATEGMGMGGVVQAVLRQLGARYRVLRIDLTTPEGLALLQARPWADGPATVVALRGLAHLVEPGPWAWRELESLLAEILETSGRVGWLAAVERTTWNWLAAALPLGSVFPELVRLDPLEPEALRRTLEARHAMSGYDLEFRATELRVRAWLRTPWRRPAEQQEELASAWFEQLHRHSEGVLSDALALWLASVRAVDERAGRVVLGACPPGPIEALDRLPIDDLLLLRQAVRLGRLDPGRHAAAFGTREVESLAELVRLEHLGLLVEEGGGWRTNPVLAGAIDRLLLRRRLSR